MPVVRRAAAVLAAVLLTSLVPGVGNAEASEIRIVRDTYGVPHVYAATAEEVSLGAGYALAQDRLWQMHVFRRIAKGELSDLLGPVVIDIDKEIRFWTYTAEERERRFARYPDDVRSNLEAFRDGINRRIAEIRFNPQLLPYEFAHFGVGIPEDWQVDDSVALGDLLIWSFGAGGGNEISYAALAQRLIDRLGPEEGLAAFDDLVMTVDDDATTTIPRDMDWLENDDRVRDAEADARRALTPDARISLDGPSITGETASVSERVQGTLAQLGLIPDVEVPLARLEAMEDVRERLERVFRFGSNAQIAGPQLAEGENALQTGGPQVGYLLPQWLSDFGLHSEDGKLDATGMTFAGAGPAVLIGRGKGYAWTTTTGSSDLTDTYVETLGPDDPRTYVFDPDGTGPDPARIEQMECRDETYSMRGVPFDTQEICRTRHGPVFAFDEENGVAYSLRYAWFDREGQTVEGFFRYNEAMSVEDFATFSNYLASNHNMFYTDDQGNYGFWHPGNHPVRAEGIDIRLPQDGRGTSEWQGLVPIQEVPHAVNFARGWLANWNNQPAAGWERERAHPPIDNVDDLERALDPDLEPVADPEGGLVNPGRPCPQPQAQAICRKLGYEDLSANLRYGAFKYHDHTHFSPFLPEADELTTDTGRAALAELASWDGFVNDPDADGLYHPGKTILDAWVDLMEDEAFRDDLGSDAGRAGEPLLWHVLNPDDRETLNRDWLNGEDARSFAAQRFDAAAAALANARGDDPSSWGQQVRLQHYQRLNGDLFTDLAIDTAGGPNEDDQGLPGDVRDHIAMDRGTYNHVVAYQTPPSGSGVLGEAAVKAGSVIPPGQNGNIDIAGREGPHYEDQLDLYLQWRYKPMPMTLAEARAVAESEMVLTEAITLLQLP